MAPLDDVGVTVYVMGHHVLAFIHVALCTRVLHMFRTHCYLAGPDLARVCLDGVLSRGVGPASLGLPYSHAVRLGHCVYDVRHSQTLVQITY